MGRKKTGEQQPLLGVGATGVRMIWGDTLQVLPTLDADSVDAIVTDPPYGLEFMGKEWDNIGISKATPVPRPGNLGGFATGNKPSFERVKKHLPKMQEWHLRWAIEALRVLKPGGHLIAFGGDRTHHRLMVAVEDAGFEIRSCLYWCHGSGFPKSLDISKAFDRMAGAEREVVGYDSSRARPNRLYDGGAIGNIGGSGKASDRTDNGATITAPATEAARQWEGWGTAMKPAVEIAVLARKPLGEGTVARNVLRHGTGALNIDACRVEGPPSQGGNSRGSSALGLMNDDGWQPKSACIDRTMSQGRWPAHLLLDGSPEVQACFPETKSGELSPHHVLRSSENLSMSGPNQDRSPRQEFGGDSGLAARFFPTFPPTETDRACAQEDRRLFYTSKAGRADREFGNTHATVKPLELMRWLVRLVTPPGGTVLDPFTGSGSTGRACAAEGFRFVGIERERAYAEIAQRRLLVSQLEVGLGGRMEDEPEMRDAETEDA